MLPCVRLLPLLLLAACGGEAPLRVADLPAAPPPTAASMTAARAVRAADSLLVASFRDEALSIAQAGIPSDASGLIGRNRQWGRMYASRFQMGTGAALRTALLAGRPDEASRALTGIEAGVSTMAPDGRLPADVPLSVSLGATPSPTDVASGAAFFLGDACLGALALEAAPNRDSVADSARRGQLRARLATAAAWLATTAPLLADGDRGAPNRLLFDARALHACGTLADQPVTQALALPFVQSALASLAPDGWFREGDGWDTSYQAVALDIGMDVVATLPEGPVRTALRDSLQVATRWLTARVAADGRVNSAGNRRTCSGGESFLGEKKTLALTSVIIGLGKTSAAATPGARTEVTDAARRVAGWARANPATNPCFEFGSATTSR